MKNQKTFVATHNVCAARIVRLIENIFPFDQTVVKRQCNNMREKIKTFIAWNNVGNATLIKFA